MQRQKQKKKIANKTRPTETTSNRGDKRHVSVLLMMMLTLVTGIVDAVGYLGLDRIFTGNMTGNIVILALALPGGTDLPVSGPLVALGAFAFGAFLAGLVLKNQPATWTRRCTLLLVTGASLLTITSATAFSLHAPPSREVGTALAAVIAAQMGMQAFVARKLAVKDLTTVVVTSTLTGLAGESVFDQGKNRIWNRRLGSIVVLFIGAIIGALLLNVHMGWPLALGAVITAGVAFWGHFRWSPAV